MIDVATYHKILLFKKSKSLARSSYRVKAFFINNNMNIEVKKSPKGTPYVMASDLHEVLQIQTKLSIWFPRMIEYGFIENEDFASQNKNVPTINGIEKVKHDWAVQLDMAKHIAMIQRSEQGKALRGYLLGLDKKVKEGELLSRPQIFALIEICKVLGFFSIQKELEADHYQNFKGSYSQ
jgi:phage anti-repressor protein